METRHDCRKEEKGGKVGGEQTQQLRSIKLVILFIKCKNLWIRCEPQHWWWFTLCVVRLYIVICTGSESGGDWLAATFPTPYCPSTPIIQQPMCSDYHVTMVCVYTYLIVVIDNYLRRTDEDEVEDVDRSGTRAPMWRSKQLCETYHVMWVRDRELGLYVITGLRRDNRWRGGKEVTGRREYGQQ